jgi:hypothetical protein
VTILLVGVSAYRLVQRTDLSGPPAPEDVEER